MVVQRYPPVENSPTLTAYDICSCENMVQIPAHNIINVLPPGGSFQGVGIGGGLTEFVINGALAQDLDNKVKEAYTFIARS